MENLTQQNKKYYNEITVARGIGILLVVLGHALKQTGERGVFTNMPVSMIYSFHMPLFFVLSGFVSVKILEYSTVKEYTKYIKNRAIRLLIPYFVMGILYMPLKYVMNSFAINKYDFSQSWRLILGDNPNTTMWFLYTLFWVSVIALILLRRSVLLPMLVISAVLSGSAYIFSWNFKIPKYLFFFIFGIYIREHYESFIELRRKKLNIFLVFIVFFCVNMVFYLRDGRGAFVTSISGTILCMWFALWIVENNKKSYDTLKSLGDASMDIYILSDPVQTVSRLILWNILHIPNILVIILCFILGTGMSFVAAKYILRRFKVFRILLFGECSSTLN